MAWLNTTAYIQLPSGASFTGGAQPSGLGSNAQFAAKKRTSSDGGDSTPIRNDAYVGFGLGQREQEVFQRCPGDSADQINGLIRATYRQVMGNPHLMESERAMACLLYTSPSPRDKRQSRMPSSA